MADQTGKLRLTLVTRERKLLDLDVEEVVLPGIEGYFGVLPGHTPLLAMLRIGALTYRAAGKETQLVLSWGFVEVLPDRVIVLAEVAFTSQEIDPATAERELRDAERELAALASHDEGFARAEAKLEESIAKIQVATGRIPH
ncbi:MAG TPA: F0F1 ATP synthase subunit epsilon [Thermoanaerobaculia bacterium]|nr:F0F1 ATP synthase subunit epsilon [Thermoanaerobaculia bacterium]